MNSMNAIRTASKLLARNPSNEASMTADSIPRCLAYRNIAIEASMPTMLDSGAAARSAGTRAPQPDPTSRIRRARAIGSPARTGSAIGRMIGLQSAS
jgi:hypothetical protein